MIEGSFWPQEETQADHPAKEGAAGEARCVGGAFG